MDDLNREIIDSLRSGAKSSLIRDLFEIWHQSSYAKGKKLPPGVTIDMQLAFYEKYHKPALRLFIFLWLLSLVLICMFYGVPNNPIILWFVRYYLAFFALGILCTLWAYKIRKHYETLLAFKEDIRVFFELFDINPRLFRSDGMEITRVKMKDRVRNILNNDAQLARCIISGKNLDDGSGASIVLGTGIDQQVVDSDRVQLVTLRVSYAREFGFLSR